MANTVIVGINWGDEGKGRMVAFRIMKTTASEALRPLPFPASRAHPPSPPVSEVKRRIFRIFRAVGNESFTCLRIRVTRISTSFVFADFSP